MSEPFEVEVDCGSANPVRFTLDEGFIRSHGGAKVRVALADDRGNPDERTRLWNGALAIARELVKANDGDPIEIFDGADVWLIPERSIRWVRLRDPESPDRHRAEIGFHVRSEYA